jgi:hypothetical protein
VFVGCGEVHWVAFFRTMAPGIWWLIIVEGREMCCSTRGSILHRLSDSLVVHELNSSALLCHHHVAHRAENRT